MKCLVISSGLSVVTLCGSTPAAFPASRSACQTTCANWSPEAVSIGRRSPARHGVHVLDGGTPFGDGAGERICQLAARQRQDSSLPRPVVDALELSGQRIILAVPLQSETRHKD